MPPLPFPAVAIEAGGLGGVLPPGPAGAALFFVAWLVASLGVVLLFDRVLLVHARRSHSRVDDVLAQALRVPLYLWLLLAGLWLGATRFDVIPLSWVPTLRVAIPAAAALVAAFALVRVATGLMAEHATRRPAFRAVQGTLEFGVRLLVWTIALMVVLDLLGVSITPLLGALGIGGLAVALALQDTLANFFAGLYLNLDRPLREGDFVEVEAGTFGQVRGYVQDVSWRSVRIRELSNNVFVMPNSKVASGVIKNYDLPQPEMSALVNLSVAYGSDLDRVEQVTVEVAREVLGRVQGGVGGFQPFIRYNAFGDSGVGFTVILRVHTFVDQYLVAHEFVKALHRRFLDEGIEIPFPQRVVRLVGAAAGAAEALPARAGPEGRARRAA
jgi:small-conductance mechanosensitive channel